jgi:hypothetical protein
VITDLLRIAFSLKTRILLASAKTEDPNLLGVGEDPNLLGVDVNSPKLNRC